MWSKEDEWCILCAHLLLYVYIALREAKAILEERVKKRGLRAGQFASKERVTSSPLTSPVPVKWAINRNLCTWAVLHYFLFLRIILQKLLMGKN